MADTRFRRKRQMQGDIRCSKFKRQVKDLRMIMFAHPRRDYPDLEYMLWKDGVMDHHPFKGDVSVRDDDVDMHDVRKGISDAFPMRSLQSKQRRLCIGRHQLGSC
eukprot:3406034-Amphidinium_carterae.1